MGICKRKEKGYKKNGEIRKENGDIRGEKKRDIKRMGIQYKNCGIRKKE